jgi:hypothetical protein
MIGVFGWGVVDSNFFVIFKFPAMNIQKPPGNPSHSTHPKPNHIENNKRIIVITIPPGTEITDKWYKKIPYRLSRRS